MNCHITLFVKKAASLIEQELPMLPEHLSSHPVYLWDTVVFSYMCSVLYIILLFHLYIILPVIRCKVLIAPL